MSFETEGVLHKVFDTESKTATFQAREFVIRHDGNYPQFIKFQLTQDKCDLINDFKVGENIKVHFDLRGREWNDKYFTNLNAWRLEQATAKTEEEGFKDLGPLEESIPSTGDADSGSEEFDDLPF